MLAERSFFPNLVDEFFGKDLLSNLGSSKEQISVPAINIIEGKEQFKIEVAAPGLGKDDFLIDVHNNVLTVSSEKEDSSEDSGHKFVRREFNYCSFKRSFALPETVEIDNIKAQHKNGVLSVTIPKKEEAKEKSPRSISIE